MLKALAGKVFRRYRHAMLVRRQRRSAKHIPMIPEAPLWCVPAGFTVQEVARTGVRFVDNFCTPEEAAEIIEVGHQLVKPSTVIGPGGTSILHDYRTSSDTVVAFSNAGPVVRRIAHRAAAILGLPVTHAEDISITRYRSNEYYKAHVDHDGSIKADRLYTMLLYLNDLSVEEGGTTSFEKLNLKLQPVLGRAMFWVNSDREKKAIKQTLHESQPVTSDTAEKWVIQLWFRTYEYSLTAKPVEHADFPPGVPLVDSDVLLPGIFLSK